MWIPEDLIRGIIWAIVIVGGMGWIMEICCEYSQDKRELKKQLQAEKAAKEKKI
ncbi:MAG: hypothetical protein Q7O12_14295 [Deltaproteobacteria bacterium]|nr:hypothetical protein [Deltaproteobacteria bacterium]